MLFDEIAWRYFTRSRPVSARNACQFVSNSATLSRAATYSRSSSAYASGSATPEYSAIRAPAARCDSISGFSMVNVLSPVLFYQMLGGAGGLSEIARA
jgi:hypothetical protein